VKQGSKVDAAIHTARRSWREREEAREKERTAAAQPRKETLPDL
jgi:hypothetical protein